MSEKISIPAMDVPVVVDAEVVIVGGGPAGLSAAIAAARAGAKTLLVERFGSLGGNATVGLVGPFMTNYVGDEPSVEGIYLELVERAVEMGGALHPRHIYTGPYSNYGPITHDHVTPFDPEIVKMVAFKMVEEAGVQLLLHSLAVKALKSRPETIDAVVVANKSGLQAVRGKVYVDGTGDGDLAALAGAEYVFGRGDGKAQPMSLFFVMAGVDTDRVIEYVEADLPNRRALKNLIREHPDEWIQTRDSMGMYLEPRKGEFRINCTRILGVDGTSSMDLTKAEMEGRKQIETIIRFVRKYAPGFEHAYVASSGATVGVRESRHVLGEYVLTGEDATEGRKFPDAIARCSYGVDIHNPTGPTTQMLPIRGDGVYDIPYRCLVPKGLDNVLLSGRCISGDHVAHASYRVMPFCFATGQAAGMAAALSAKGAIRPRDLDVAALQRQLAAAGASLGRQSSAEGVVSR